MVVATGPCGAVLVDPEPEVGGVVGAEGLEGGGCVCVGPAEGGGEPISFPPRKLPKRY